MDLLSYKDLGIAGIAVAGLAFVCFQLIKQSDKKDETFTKETSEARLNYQSFVMDNNHTTTDLVRQATATMVEIKNTIETHNKMTEKILERLNK